MKKQHGASCTCDDCMDKDERKWTVWHEPKPCEHCGEPLLIYACPLCAPCGYLWADDGAGGYRAVDCWDCGGSAEKAVCTNTDCPGKIWYPLRMAQQRVMEDEKR